MIPTTLSISVNGKILPFAQAKNFGVLLDTTFIQLGNPVFSVFRVLTTSHHFHCYHVALSHHHLQLRLFQRSPLQPIFLIMASPSLQNTLNKRATITCYIRSFCSFSQNHPMPFMFPPLPQWPLSCHSTYALTIFFYYALLTSYWQTYSLISFRPLLRCHLFITDFYNQPN